MLQFILGGAKTGKTTKIKELILQECKKLIENGNEKKDEKVSIILIVPEQFTYETEKKLFKELSPNFFRLIKVTSFSRISTEIFSRFGGVALEVASTSAKIALMDIAINSLQGEFEVYKKASSFKSFSKLMLDTITELKNAGVSPEQFNDTLQQIDGNLQNKISEINAVYRAYDALLSASFRDSLDDITRAGEITQGTDYFNNCSVFFDEFKGFTANENQFIKNILQSAKTTVMGLCLDLEVANNQETSVFSSVKKVYEKITRFAKDVNCKIASNINLKQTFGYNSPELPYYNENLFSPKALKYQGENQSIFPFLCKNEYDEIDIALSQIKMLVKDENYLYNDIAIISRDLSVYQNKFVVAFKKYEIPFYCDIPQSISQKSLIRLVKNALKCVTDGFKSENILSVLKCELTKFTAQDVAELENYAYVWSLNASAWKSEFTSNPRGFADFFDEDNEVLARINVIREHIINALMNFSNSLKNSNGVNSCQAVMTLLFELQVKEQTQKTMDYYLKKCDFNLAQEYKNVWEIFINQINILSITMQNEQVTAKRFAQLFELVCEEETIDSLPQSLDCVIVGDAQNIRISDKKAVFILGVNDGVFPFVPKNTGVFTNDERKKLIECDISISPPIIDCILEERFIAYKTLTSPTDKLFLTARKADILGKPMQPSLVFSRLKKIFGSEIVIDSENSEKISGEFYCQNKDMSFAYLAKTYFDDNELTASLKEVFLRDEFYKNKIEMIQKINKKEPFEIKNIDNCKKIFDDANKKMNISPTRIESFYQCAFRYFCQHGLRVYPLKKAELNPLETGALIHKILCDITSKYDLKNDFDEKKIKAEIKLQLDIYIEQVMGGVNDKTKRFLYIYQKIRKQIFRLLQHLHEEFLQSEFTTTDFEFDINEFSEVTPLKLEIKDKTEVIISGKIDRIDSYVSKTGQKYIRIVDYKSSKKTFKLNDVLYGLNLQMLVYLFCIASNGKGKYSDCKPAGILYLTAGAIKPNLSRLATESDKNKELKDFYKMNGLLLNETEVLEAMEKGLSGQYIPVSQKKDGTFYSQSLDSLASKEEIGKINNYINKLIVNMAEELHYGKISAKPLEGSCEYCDYGGVCGKNESESEQYKKFSRDEIIKQMQQFNEEGENQNG